MIDRSTYLSAASGGIRARFLWFLNRRRFWMSWWVRTSILSRTKVHLLRENKTMRSIKRSKVIWSTMSMKMMSALSTLFSMKILLKFCPCENQTRRDSCKIRARQDPCKAHAGRVPCKFRESQKFRFYENFGFEDKYLKISATKNLQPGENDADKYLEYFQIFCYLFY